MASRKIIGVFKDISYSPKLHTVFIFSENILWPVEVVFVSILMPSSMLCCIYHTSEKKKSSQEKIWRRLRNQTASLAEMVSVSLSEQVSNIELQSLADI